MELGGEVGDIAGGGVQAGGLDWFGVGDGGSYFASVSYNPLASGFQKGCGMRKRTGLTAGIGGCDKLFGGEWR